MKQRFWGNEFYNLQFHRVECFTAADPAEGAQVNEGTRSCFDDSEPVIHSQKVTVGVGWVGVGEVRVCGGVCVYVPVLERE